MVVISRSVISSAAVGILIGLISAGDPGSSRACSSSRLIASSDPAVPAFGGAPSPSWGGTWVFSGTPSSWIRAGSTSSAPAGFGARADGEWTRGGGEKNGTPKIAE